MKIIVTGSEGSLMQATIPLLLAHGHRVIGVDNLSRYGVTNSVKTKEYEFHQLDITNKKDFVELSKGADVIIHAAAKVYGVLGLAHYCGDTLADEVTMCSNMLNACVENNIRRIVYLSSSMVYESCLQDVNFPLTEEMTDSTILPKTDYGLGKLVSERMCQAFHRQHGIDYTIWRPFNIVSPYEQSMDEVGFSHVIPDFIEKIVFKKLNPVPIIGDGEQIRCFTWVGDVARIIADYSMSDNTRNNIFNICNVQPISMKELAGMISYLSGKSSDNLKFDTTPGYKHDVKIRVPSINKLRRIIGSYEFLETQERVTRCLQTIT